MKNPKQRSTISQRRTLQTVFQYPRRRTSFVEERFQPPINKDGIYSATILTYCFNTGGIVKTVADSQLNFAIVPRLSKD